MNLGEKIIGLRKREGWSQEELAGRLEISRQSVSKWESNTSVPELDKIVRLSEIFGVSVDYLLKEPVEQYSIGQTSEVNNMEDGSSVRKLSPQLVKEYLELSKKSAKKIALGVLLCILSPVTLIVLGGLADETNFVLSENVAVAIGLIVLLGLVAIAVAIFIVVGIPLGKYDYLEKEVFEIDRSVAIEVKEKKEAFAPTYRLFMAIGVVLCILSVIPLLVFGVLEMGDAYYIVCIGILFVIAAVGVYLIVWVAMIWGSFEKILQEGDYTRKVKKRIKGVSEIYWCLITAIYLASSFWTMRWDRTWIIWPCAGVLYGAIEIVLQNISGDQ